MKETVEEYLKRGGKVERLDSVQPNFSQRISSSANVQSIISLDEGAHFFSEFKPKKTKSKKKLNVSSLPDFLRKMVKED